MEILSHALYMLLLLRPLSILYHTIFMRGSHPLPNQLPGEHTGLHLMRGSTSLSFDPSMQHLRIHSLIVDRSTVAGHVPMDHTCSFMCTSHIDMTAHNPAFIQVG